MTFIMRRAAVVVLLVIAGCGSDGAHQFGGEGLGTGGAGGSIPTSGPGGSAVAPAGGAGGSPVAAAGGSTVIPIGSGGAAVAAGGSPVTASSTGGAAAGGKPGLGGTPGAGGSKAGTGGSVVASSTGGAAAGGRGGAPIGTGGVAASGGMPGTGGLVASSGGTAGATGGAGGATLADCASRGIQCPADTYCYLFSDGINATCPPIVTGGAGGGGGASGVGGAGGAAPADVIGADCYSTACAGGRRCLDETLTTPGNPSVVKCVDPSTFPLTFCASQDLPADQSCGKSVAKFIGDGGFLYCGTPAGNNAGPFPCVGLKGEGFLVQSCGQCSN